MTYLNRVVITGKVVMTPKLQYQPNGTPVLQFPLELNDSKDLSDQALNRGVLRHLQSGQHLLVKGRLNQRHWQTPDGKNRSRTEVIATELCPVEAERKIDSTKRGEDDEKTG